MDCSSDTCFTSWDGKMCYFLLYFLLKMKLISLNVVKFCTFLTQSYHVTEGFMMLLWLVCIL